LEPVLRLILWDLKSDWPVTLLKAAMMDLRQRSSAVSRHECCANFSFAGSAHRSCLLKNHLTASRLWKKQICKHPAQFSLTCRTKSRGTIEWVVPPADRAGRDL
jgi:hypothetical protein